MNGLSFIIIGRNEAKNLTRCINSIYASIEALELIRYEIIYVDSRSEDQSLEIVRSYPDIRIFKITGLCNAAIGRNVGAKEARGDIFYFIDADMEIEPSFLQSILNEDGSLKYPVVSGLIKDIENGVATDIRYQDLQLPFFASETLDGGIFLIKKEIWDLVDGMRTKYQTGEDGDLGLRLAAAGKPFIRIPKIITQHHTISYHDPSRIWKMVWNRSIFYWRCVLYRDHLWRKDMYGLLWKNDKSLIFLIIVLITGIAVPSSLLIGSLIYVFLIIFRSLRQKRSRSTWEYFAYFLVVDLLNIVFFFTFYPRDQKVEYQAHQEILAINLQTESAT